MALWRSVGEYKKSWSRGKRFLVRPKLFFSKGFAVFKKDICSYMYYLVVGR